MPLVDDMRVYIANLGKYNEGELVGDWFSFPIDEEEVAERIGLDSYYEEYAVHDTDNFPIEIGEYVSIEQLNEMYEMICELLLKENAVMNEYYTLLNSEEKVTILTLGPLTNIALLIATFPEIKEKIDEIIMMGGSTERGNIGIYGEFNVMIDPEAAKMVFRSGTPITMVGLDIGRKARLTVEDLKTLEKSGEVGNMVSSLFRAYDGGHIEEGIKMYDPSAAMYLMDPELFEVKDAFIDVEISSPLTIGATVVDYDGTLCAQKNAKVCVDVDVERFRRRYVQRVAEVKC